MARARRSRSAQVVAAERAVLHEMGVVDDPYARTMLDPSISLLFRVARRWPQRVPSLPVTLAGLAGRVRWHDAQVVQALGAGIDQVVVVGAGYDSRAWRLRREGVAFFEVDHPATQAAKARRAPAGRAPTYVAVDLAVDSAADALATDGFDPSRPAVLVVEGVTMYLPEEAVRRQLTELADACAPGSRLTTDFYPPSDSAPTGHRTQDRVQALARSGSGEALRLLVARDDAVALIEGCGWRVDAVSGARAAAEAVVPAGSGLPVAAVNDRKTLLAAVRGAGAGADRPGPS